MGVRHAGSLFLPPEPAPLMAEGPHTSGQLYLEQGRPRKSGWGRWAGAAATYIALLKQVGVIPAVVEQPLPCVPHVTVQAEVDVGIRPRTFEVPPQCTQSRGTGPLGR